MQLVLDALYYLVRSYRLRSYPRLRRRCYRRRRHLHRLLSEILELVLLLGILGTLLFGILSDCWRVCDRSV